MVTVRTFISYVGKTDLPNGQIHLRSPEVNSSRVLFYLQVKNSGKVILLISAPKVFKHIWIFWSVNSRRQDAQECSRSKRRFGFFYLAVISYANSTCKVKTGKEVDDSFPKNFFHRVSCPVLSSRQKKTVFLFPQLSLWGIRSCQGKVYCSRDISKP